MRATEALELSNPKTKLDKDNLSRLTHLDHTKNKAIILTARLNNRASLKNPQLDLFR